MMSPDGKGALRESAEQEVRRVQRVLHPRRGNRQTARPGLDQPRQPAVHMRLEMGDDQSGDSLVTEVFSSRCSMSSSMKRRRLVFPPICSAAAVTWAWSPSSDGRRLFIADDADRLSCLGLDARAGWRVQLGSVSWSRPLGGEFAAAGWDGRIRAISGDGKLVWMLDCTAACDSPNPLADIVTASDYKPGSVIEARRPSSATPETPQGQDLVVSNLVHLGGEKIDGELLAPMQRGIPPSQSKPIVPTQQLLQDMMLTIEHDLFWVPTPMTSAISTTIAENPDHPESYPTDSFIGVWNDANKQWDTVKRGVFLSGPVNTYALNLKGVTRLILLPCRVIWNNFYTIRIEVRTPHATDGYAQNFDRLAPGSIAGQDFWKGGSRDQVVPNPAGGQMLKVLDRAERPMVFNTDPRFVRQTATFDFLLNRTINDPAYAVTSGVKQRCSTPSCSTDPIRNRIFASAMKGPAEVRKEAWLSKFADRQYFRPEHDRAARLVSRRSRAGSLVGQLRFQSDRAAKRKTLLASSALCLR